MSIAQDIAAGFAALAADVGVPVTYRRMTPGAYNATSLTRDASTSSTSITAFRGDAFRGDAMGAVTVESRVYTVNAADLAFTPDVGDTLTDAGAVYAVALVATDAAGLVHRLTCSRTL